MEITVKDKYTPEPTNKPSLPNFGDMPKNGKAAGGKGYGSGKKK